MSVIGANRDHSNKAPSYCELAATSNFSFLYGASHPEELVTQAAHLGLNGIGITDRNSVAGVVRGHMAAKEAGIGFVPGCRLVFCDGTPDILAWPMDRQGWSSLCELLSLGKRKAPKGECYLHLADLTAHHEGLSVAMVLDPKDRQEEQRLAVIDEALGLLKQVFSTRFRLGLWRCYGVDDQRHMVFSQTLADHHTVKLLALGAVLYHHPDRRALQDVISAIREHETLSRMGAKLEANAERFLRSPKQMASYFAGYEAALEETRILFDQLQFSLDELRYQYPEDPVFEALGNRAMKSQAALECLTQQGVKRRYPDGVPDKVRHAIAHELGLIEKLAYAPYFLTVYDIVRFARSQHILCQGRGSAANSAVCYCLGITEVDPDKVDLLFERFISEERNEPPDIDVDFEHERREEVIQYIYEKYGRAHAGIAATVVSYRARSAIREVGKVFGLSEDAIGAIASTKWGVWSSEVGAEDARRAGFDPTDKHLMQMLDLAGQIIGFPRHLSQHVGGFVITRDRLSSLIPIENAAMEDRTIVEWDKDDLESLGMLKIDVLALGMLTCLRKGFELLAHHYNRMEDLGSLPQGDKDTYDMICRADTVGVFQIESRAQMSMLPRLRPRTYYDLVIEVAIVRPGPIQGDMVHPYLRRRQGKEVVRFPKEELRQVLGKTLGVPLFQEQAMNIAIVAAKFEPGEADKLRRAMATFRRVGTIGHFQQKMVEGMVKNGYEQKFAEHCFRQIEGFGDYGFPESHAASFALLVYVSCWMKCHYPDVFCAAILNSQPMGFYAPAQLVRDAREHGVEVRAVDVNYSQWDTILEQGGKRGRISSHHRSMAHVMKHRHAVRLGFRQVKGLKRDDVEALIASRGSGFDSVRDIWMRAGLGRGAMEKLAEADCFRSLGMDRRVALWAVKALDPLGAAERLPLFAQAGGKALQKEPDVALPPMPIGEHVINDYQALSFSLKAHLVSFVRKPLSAEGYCYNEQLGGMRSGQWVRVAGLVLVRQRPGSAKGVVFETIEDESGVANVIIWPKIFERYRNLVLGCRFVGVWGRLQNEEGVIHVVAKHMKDLTPLLGEIGEGECFEKLPKYASSPQNLPGLAHADEVRRPVEDVRHLAKPGVTLARLLNAAPQIKHSQPNMQANHPVKVKGTDRNHLEKQILPKGRNFH